MITRIPLARRDFRGRIKAVAWDEPNFAVQLLLFGADAVVSGELEHGEKDADDCRLVHAGLNMSENARR